MNNLSDLLDLANSLEWFELETEEQEILTELEASVASIEKQWPSGMYTISVWGREYSTPYVKTLRADTLDDLHEMIFDHYSAAINRLALNEYK